MGFVNSQSLLIEYRAYLHSAIELLFEYGTYAEEILLFLRSVGQNFVLGQGGGNFVVAHNIVPDDGLCRRRNIAGIHRL